jgi:Na+/H+ antiporter NhaD/arsenite permease-like protein
MSSQATDPINLTIFLTIFVITYWMIIDPRINKHLAAFIGGVMAISAGWATGLFNEDMLVEHLRGDLLILVIIIGNLIVVDVASKSGLFYYISIILLKKTRGDPMKLLIYMGFLSVLLSIVVSNISAILITASLTIIACERLDYDPFPYILVQMILVDVAGLFTLVSSLPNIIIGLELGIDYLEFLKIGVIVATILTIVFYILVFIMLKVPQASMNQIQREKIVDEFDEWAAVDNKKAFYASAIILVLMIVLFVLSSIINIGIATISLIAAAAMLISSGADFDEAIEAVDWPLLTFFMGLFIVIAGLDFSGAIFEMAELIANISGGNIIVAICVILWASAIFSGIVDNIVIAVALAPVIEKVAVTTGHELILAWALILGANLGGGLSPVGSPSNLIGINILAKRTGKHISWSEWLKKPGLMTLILLIVANLLILLIFWISIL